MEVSPEIRASHRDLSPAAEKYLDFLAGHPEWQRPAAEIMNVPPEQLEMPLQCWPTLLGRERYDELMAATSGVLGLIKRIPSVLFGNDPAALRAAYDLADEAQAAALLGAPDQAAGAIARCDLVRSAEGWKCLEVNVSPALGGAELYEVALLYAQQPAVKDFLDGQGLTVEVADTPHLLYAHLLQDTLRHLGDTGGEVNTAWWWESGGLDFDDAAAEINVLYQEVLAQLGGGLRGTLQLFAAADELEPRADGLYLRGQRVHALLRVSLYDLPAHVQRAVQNGQVRMFGNPMDMLLSDKRNFWLLSEEADSATCRFSPRERELIRRHVPWSRRVVAGETTFRGQKVSLPDFLLDHRERLLLKPFIGHGGRAVEVGWSSTPERWQQAVAEALADGSFLVQEFWPSRPYLFQHGEQGTAVHRMVWGAFVFGGQPGGCMVRMVPAAADSGVVSVSKGSFRGVVLVV